MEREPYTILDQIKIRSEKDPHLRAVTFLRHSLSYRELYNGIRKTAAGLLSFGLCPGDRVILALPNGGDFFRVFYGIMMAGGIAVPLFFRSSTERIKSIASMCDAHLVLVECHDGVSPPHPMKQLKGLSFLSPDRIISSLAVKSEDVPEIDPSSPAYIQYTSGSTSDPRGVIVTHYGLVTNLKQMIEGFNVTVDDVFVSWLPTYHDMGLVLMTMVPFYLGIPLVLLRATLTNVRQWLKAIGDFRGTFTAAPDFAYRLCLAHIQDPQEYDLSSLRVALNAAEPVRIRTIEMFEKRFGLSNVMTPAYGLAEATVGVSTWPPGIPVLSDERSFVSVGKPFPDVEIKIDRDGSDEVGEILVRSPANTCGYWGNPDATRELYSNSGYIRTGDLGYLDEDSHLFIVGRKKNIIIHAGNNIAPKEIEEIIDPLPFVRASAAFGIEADQRSGEQIYVFVEIKNDLVKCPEQWEDSSIRITETFFRYFGFRPGKIILVKPGTIPYTSNRKVKYNELKELYERGYYKKKGYFLFPDF